MKKSIILILVFSVSVLLATSVVQDLQYEQNHLLNFKIQSGDFRLNTWSSADSLFRNYSCDLANNTISEKTYSYDVFQFPIAISNSLPLVSVSILETRDFEHQVKSLSLYSLSEVKQFRDKNFVYLVINPFLANNKVASKLSVQIDLGEAIISSQSDKFDQFFINKDYASGLKGEKPSYTLSKQNNIEFNGDWLEFSVNDEGIFYINKSDLINAGVSNDIRDDNLFLFAGPGFGTHLRDQFPDSSDFHLKQVPLLFMQGRGNTEDKWVFYASPSSSWRRMSEVGDIRYHDYVRVPYSDEQIFKLFIGASSETPKRMQQNLPNFSGNEQVVNYFYERHHFEEELINPGKGGELWLGGKLKSNNNFPFYLNNLYTDTVLPAYMRLAVGLISKGWNEYIVYINGSQVELWNAYTSSDSDDKESVTQVQRKRQYRIDNTELTENTEVSIAYSGSLSTTESFLDYIDLIYPVKPIAIDGMLDLWFKESPLDQKITVTELTSSINYVFSVDDPFSTNYYPVSGSSADILIPSSTQTSAYIVLNENHFKPLTNISILPNFEPGLEADHRQQADLLIITPDDFKSEAERLASFKETRAISPLTTHVKTYSEIIDQFNAGNNDPYAIWHYLADMYMMAPDPKPQYVILLGDGHFDYQNKSYTAKNYMPFLYEPNSLWPCDDIFVMVNSREDKTNDMAIGRIPANSLSEAKYVVDKIIHYDSREEQGEWQLNSMLVADDPSDPPQGWPFYNQVDFIDDSEILYNNFLPKSMQAKKVYLTEYPERYVSEIQTTGRDGAREDIMESFFNGVSFVNYYGHGDPSVWSQEKVFVKNDLVRLEVNKKYPFVLAATCSWGRSDNPDYQSMAEDMVTLEENGAIATLATVRGVLHGGETSNNVKFVQDFTEKLFNNSQDFSRTQLLGDPILYSKNNSSSSISSGSKESNNLKFMYFGDPTLIPAFPQNLGVLDSVSRDTLRALDKVLVEGRALTLSGENPFKDGIHGKITVYDNDYRVSREFIKNDSGDKSTISYYLEGNRLFNGDVDFQGNEFSTQVFIPKDIQYNGTEGKIRIMYWNEDGTFDGAGVIDNIHVGGINPDAALDITGPDIQVCASEVELSNGAIINDTTLIKIYFEDESGVNITGSSGHVLEMNIDNGQQKIDISELFSYKENAYSSGVVEFFASSYLDEGEHLIEISAYDNYNNYSKVEIMINVISEDGDALQNLVNFPNPFKRQTDITFSSLFSATANLRVYTISGKKVFTLNDVQIDAGFNTIPFTAEDEYGHVLAAGVYLYVLEIDNGLKSMKQHNKMLVLP